MASFDFNQTAARLSRNPLGIIALFIVLVYAMASLVLVQGHFEGSERLPLVWFLVVFPPAVLVAFVFLVAKHHTKLYAPGDYRNEDNFVSALDPAARRRRLELEGEEPSSPSEREGRPQPESRPPTGGEPLSARLLGGATRYFIAEELVLRKLGTEWQVPIQREVRVGDVAVNGVAFQKDGGAVVVDVKAPRHETLAARAVLRAAEQASAAISTLQRHRRSARFLIAVLLPNPKSPVDLTNRLNQLLREKGFPSTVECRVFSIRTLADEFGLSEPMALSA